MARYFVQESDIKGKKYGRLTPIYRTLVHKPGGEKRWYWHCECDCGGSISAYQSLLHLNKLVSCGCIRLENGKKRATHGECAKGGSTEYLAWTEMKKRCLRPTYKDYHHYGGRGIKICDRWVRSFSNFLSDMGRKPTGRYYSLDRFPNKDGNYEPGNCRWTTYQQQNRNNSQNRIIEIDGVKKCLAEWVESSPVTAPTIRNRLKNGWDAHKAVFGKSRTAQKKKSAD